MTTTSTTKTKKARTLKSQTATAFLNHQLKIRVSDAMREAYESQAKRDGVTDLAAWMRATLNKASGFDGVVSPLTEDGGLKERTAAKATKTPAPKRVRKAVKRAVKRARKGGRKK